MPGSPRSSERGYVLIGAIWLLVLAGSLAAALMLRSLAGAREAAAESEALRDKLALDGAVQAALAAMLFDGDRASSTRTMTIDGRTLDIAFSSENGRIDANAADLPLIEQALRGAGLDAAARGRIVQGFAAARAAKREIGSQAELRALLAGGDGATEVCVADMFTLASRLTRPLPGQTGEKVGRALGMATSGPGAAPGNSGAPLRIEATLPEGAVLTAVARITGLSQAPLSIHRWEYRRDCPYVRRAVG